MRDHLAVSAVLIGLFVVQAFGEPVRWRTGDALPEAMAASAIQQKTGDWHAEHARGGLRERHALIQLSQPVDAQDKEGLARNGVHLLRPLGGNAFFATVDAASVESAALVQEGVTGVHELERNWKLHPRLVAGDPPSWSVVSREADGQTPDRIAAYVILHHDVDAAAVRPGLMNRHDLVVQSELKAINALVVELPASVRDQLARLQERFRGLGRAVRWTRVEQIHLTLKFLGDVPDCDVPAVCDAAAKVAARFEPFELTVARTGCFPPRGAARIVWAGIDGPPQPLIDCHRACEQAYADLGFKPEGRPFSPHLTIGRVRDAHTSHEIRAAVDAESAFSAGSFPVDELVMFESVLRPVGPIYTAISRVPLAQAE